VSGEVCTKKEKKLWKEIKKDLTEPALLEMDGFGVYQELEHTSERAPHEF